MGGTRRGQVAVRVLSVAIVVGSGLAAATGQASANEIRTINVGGKYDRQHVSVEYSPNAASWTARRITHVKFSGSRGGSPTTQASWEKRELHVYYGHRDHGVTTATKFGAGPHRYNVNCFSDGSGCDWSNAPNDTPWQGRSMPTILKSYFRTRVYCSNTCTNFSEDSVLYWEVGRW